MGKDYYFRKAKTEKYYARSVYKLMEIDQKFGIVKKGQKVLDIGCAPGSWSQYLLKKIGKGQVVGIDLAAKVQIRHSRFTYIREDIFAIDRNTLLGTLDNNSSPAPAGGHESTSGSSLHEKSPRDFTTPSGLSQKTTSHPSPSSPWLFDLVLSDALPNTTASKFMDSQRSIELVKRVFQIADNVLKPGGTVAAKVFQGEDVGDFTDKLNRNYSMVKFFKPKSSTTKSREIFIIAGGLKKPVN